MIHYFDLTFSAEYSFRKSLLEGKAIKGQEKTDGNEVIQVDITSSKTFEKKSPKRNIEEKQSLLKRESVEKQKAYSDAFLDQMNRYIQYGELESKHMFFFVAVIFILTVYRLVCFSMYDFVVDSRC